MLNFNFLEKGLGLISPPHFGFDFSKKIFLLADQFQTSLLLEIQTICVLQSSVSQVVTS